MRKTNFRYFKLLPIVLGLFLGGAITAQEPGYVPKDGFIPDTKTAIAIAKSILTPIYGSKQIESEEPFHAILDKSGVWTVEGSLPSGRDGVVAEVKLSRQDARILYVTHGK